MKCQSPGFGRNETGSAVRRGKTRDDEGEDERDLQHGEGILKGASAAHAGEVDGRTNPDDDERKRQRIEKRNRVAAIFSKGHGCESDGR